MLTKAQNTLYFREWGSVRKALIDGGRTSKEADDMRHILTERVLGYAKPHARLTNAEFDAILGAFRAISRADDIDAQLRQLEQPIERARRVVAELQASMNLSDAYIAGTCRNICKRSLAECTVQDLTTKIIQALTYHKNRLAKRTIETPSTQAENPF